MNNTTSHQGRLKSLRAAGIGNALEWFDWTLYATFSVYLASNLFDKTDARSAMLATLAVFAVGFVIDLDFDAVVQPVSTCVSEAQPSKYESYTCGQHKFKRFVDSYAHLKDLEVV